MVDLLVSDAEHRLLVAIQDGFPVTTRPFAEIGQQIGMTEAEVLAALADLKQRKIIKRMGVIVRHRELGYLANAMVVWDVPERLVGAVGKRMGAFDYVTLCYQRRPSLPLWPYNLYCMIHGRERDLVLLRVEELAVQCSLEKVHRQVLFSRRCFKQRGACYFHSRV